MCVIKNSLCLSFYLCFLGIAIFTVAQELPDPPDPQPSPTPLLTSTQLPSISIPPVLQINSVNHCDIRGISLEDVTKGKVIVKVYPRDVVINDGISFITRNPYLVLRPKATGMHTLVFILLRDGKLTIIEEDFEVVEGC